MMKSWPKNPQKVVDFSKAITPIKRLLLNILKSPQKDHKYTGYKNMGTHAACCFSGEDIGNAECRNYHIDDQGRDVYDMILQLTWGLAMEQGRREAEAELPRRMGRRAYEKMVKEHKKIMNTSFEAKELILSDETKALIKKIMEDIK